MVRQLGQLSWVCPLNQQCHAQTVTRSGSRSGWRGTASQTFIGAQCRSHGEPTIGSCFIVFLLRTRCNPSPSSTDNEQHVASFQVESVIIACPLGCSWFDLSCFRDAAICARRAYGVQHLHRPPQSQLMFLLLRALHTSPAAASSHLVFLLSQIVTAPSCRSQGRESAPSRKWNLADTTHLE